MAKKGINKNSENDKALRVGRSAVYHVTKNKTRGGHSSPKGW